VNGKLRVLDLFSGIGGFSLGLERAGGFETVAFCEIEPYCRKVLAKHWPHVPCYDDVRTLTADTLRRDGIAVDAICGGFPCTDLSVANVFGKGLAGERSGLWREYARLVRELRPQFVIVENVAILLGRGADDVLGDFAEAGYDAEWAAIPASRIGAPHHRDRLWIVAHPRRTRRQRHQQIFSIFESEAAASAFDGNPFADAWRALDGGFADIRPGNGLSVVMERRKLSCTGNAVVPQIPELIGKAIMQAVQAEGMIP
jgi:DNA (cytosine-5)-methyltransferase 1